MSSKITKGTQVKFILGTASLVLALSVTLGLRGQGQKSADPFVKDKSTAKAKAKAKVAGPKVQAPQLSRTMTGILLEYIEVDHLDAVRLVRKHGGALDSIALRTELDPMISSNRARLLDTIYVTAPSGERVRRSSVLEKIYPTEYDPPEIPQNMMLTNKEGKVLGPEQAATLAGVKTAANPTAFEARSVGLTLEAEVIIGEAGEISCNIAPEVVSFEGWRFYMDPESPHAEARDIRMPIFYSMRTSTAFQCKDGAYALIGCLKPHKANGKRVLALMKVDILK